MSEASERLRDIIEDGSIAIWPDIGDNIKTVLDELDACRFRLDKLRRQLAELQYSPALTMREGNSDLRLIVGMMLRESEPLTDGGDVGTK